METHNILNLIYNYDYKPYTYGAVIIVDGKSNKPRSSDPFAISKNINNNEIVYGSVLNLIYKIKHLINQFKDFHKQEQKIEEMILILSLYSRNLVEIFKEKENICINLYNYKRKKVKETIKLIKLLHCLIHFRYFYVQEGYVCDLFSDKNQLYSKGLFGYKIKIKDFLNAVSNVVSGIKVRDFFCVLLNRIKKMSVKSKREEIIFVVQNVHSLANFMKERFQHKNTLEVIKIIFDEEKRRYSDEIKADTHINKITLSSPTFKISQDLSEKEMAIYTTLNGDTVNTKLGYEDFFNLMIKAYGNDALVSVEP